MENAIEYKIMFNCKPIKKQWSFTMAKTDAYRYKLDFNGLD